MPRPIIYFLLFLVALSLIPMGLVYKARATRMRDQTRIQVVYDMDNQYYFKPQSQNPFFDNDMAMRKPVDGTVARGQAWTDDLLDHGRVQGDSLFVETFPVTVDRPLIDRGEERFNIYCAPCHGLSGDGNGLVHARAASLAEGTWTPPTDLGSQTVVERPVGHLYNTIKNGIRSMPSYGSQIPVQDRWAIVAYVRALQLARAATMADVPAAERAALVNAAPNGN